jgi:hypothetical protein
LWCHQPALNLQKRCAYDSLRRSLSVPLGQLLSVDMTMTNKPQLLNRRSRMMLKDYPSVRTLKNVGNLSLHHGESETIKRRAKLTK